MKLLDAVTLWLLRGQHWWHGAGNCLVEHAPQEVYLRCQACGLRSPGVLIGPLRVRQAPARVALRLVHSDRRAHENR